MPFFDPDILDTKTLEQLEMMLDEEKDDVLKSREINDAILRAKLSTTGWRNCTVAEWAKVPLKTDVESRRVEIIILGWELPDVEVDCISHIIKNNNHPYKITFYDNRPNSANGCNTSKIWNKLVRESTCPYVLIMDSDAFMITFNSVGKMVEALERHPNAAVVAPATEGGATIAQKEYIENGNEIIIEKGGHVSGFCFMFRREFFDKIGPFDEDFYVYGQDSDWMNRINELGYTILMHSGVLIRHGYDKNTYSMSNRKANSDGKFNIQADSMYAGALVRQKQNDRFEERKKEQSK